MKMALVHDYLCDLGGSERIFQYICEEFPEADVYTLAYNQSKTYPYFSTRKIHTSWLNKFVQSTQAFRWFFPIAAYAMQAFDFSEYDIVLSSSATVAKYISPPNNKHICYCYIPTRALWHFDQYFAKDLKAKMLKPLFAYLRKRDYLAAQRVSHFITISNYSRDYIRLYYNRDAEVIYCPIEMDKFYLSERKKNHYLIVSRLEHWKQIEYAIEAFNRMGLLLRIIGTGKEESRLHAMSKPNITFLGAVDDATLAREYSEALAIIFTPFIEYGLIPLEANASGTPVICYGKGGVTETMIPINKHKASEESPTAVFFYEQTADALIEAVRYFEAHLDCFDPISIREHVRQFDRKVFKEKIYQYIQLKVQEYNEARHAQKTR